MAKLIWGSVGERRFEAGVDRGVLFPNSGPGVPWNGLVSVEESPDGGESRPYYVDGFKYLNISASEEFAGTISAYSAPPEFGRCDGTLEIHNGLFATQQPRHSFGFSYRTKIGNDVEGVDHGYKIHLVYNALAGSSQRQNTTLSDSSEPSELSWEITTRPPLDQIGKPTAHFVVDSTKANPITLAYLEHLIYGGAIDEPRLPTPSELYTLFEWSVEDVDIPVNLIGEWATPNVVVSNLFTNPSFEAGAGTVEVRRNWIRDPKFDLLSNWGTQTTGTITKSSVNGKPAALISAGWGANLLIGSLHPDSSGKRFAARVTLVPTATTAGAQIRIHYYDGAIYGDAVFTLPTTPGEEFEAVLPASRVSEGYTRLYFAGFGGTWAEGDEFYVVSPLMEEASSEGALPGEYFDGDTSPDSDLTPSWVGAPNNSESILTGVVPSETISPSVGQMRDYLSSDSPYVGALVKRSRLTASTAVGVPASPITLPVNGQEYTLLMRARAVDRTQVVTPRVQVTNAPPVTLVQGVWEEIRITVTAGAGTAAQTGLLIYAGSGHQVGDRIDIDAAGLFAGEYTGEWFDGNSPNARWVGGVDSSISQIDIPETYPPITNNGDAYIINGYIWVLVNGTWTNYGLVPEI